MSVPRDLATLVRELVPTRWHQPNATKDCAAMMSHVELIVLKQHGYRSSYETAWIHKAVAKVDIEWHFFQIL